MPKTLAAMPYFGGKASRVQGTGRWIAALLGTGEECYAEVCGGMLGLMLQRPRAPKEIANDLDGLVFNWWHVVRDRHDELAELLEWTPDLCRQTLGGAFSEMESDCPIRRAWAFTVINGMSAAQAGFGPSGHNIALTYDAKVTPRRLAVRSRLKALAERIRHVQLECTDAVGLLERVARHPDSLSYVDPPYRSVSSAPYRHSIDYDALIAVCRTARGRIAVSGYRDEYPELEEAGWRHHDFKAYTGTPSPDASNREPRVESLWMNFESAGQSSLPL